MKSLCNIILLLMVGCVSVDKSEPRKICEYERYSIYKYYDSDYKNWKYYAITNN